MPYTIRKNKGGGYDIIRKDLNKKVGHSNTKAKAEASVRARYAGEHNPLWNKLKKVGGK